MVKVEQIPDPTQDLLLDLRAQQEANDSTQAGGDPSPPETNRRQPSGDSGPKKRKRSSRESAEGIHPPSELATTH